MRLSASLPLILAAACAHGDKAPAPPAPQQQVPPPDLPAVFAGTLPCADCPGIETRLVFLDPARYVLAERFLEREVEPRFSSGAWVLEGETLRLADRAFRWDGETLLALDAGGKPIPVQGRNTLSPGEAPTLAFGTIRRTTDGLKLEPCGGGARIEVVDGTAHLSQAIEELPGSFVELVALPAGEQLWAVDLQRIAMEGPGCEQLPTGLVARASGNEPFWGLEIDQRSLRLERLGQDPVGTPWAPFRWERGAYRYFADAGETRLGVVLTPGFCPDTMAPVATGYRAEVEVNGEKLQGCAWLGTEWKRLDGP
ncbi:copper resistance protein NlpE N-terminal domain-containing protein [Vulgatibacter sp.]|uniref:copper resistance protein NlpE N-terminal domain-containing protein n=1 Tax=Vulgatibacter sp. TaxID=1971226 RepID=UPI003564F627